MVSRQSKTNITIMCRGRGGTSIHTEWETAEKKGCEHVRQLELQWDSKLGIDNQCSAAGTRCGHCPPNLPFLVHRCTHDTTQHCDECPHGYCSSLGKGFIMPLDTRARRDTSGSGHGSNAESEAENIPPPGTFTSALDEYARTEHGPFFRATNPSFVTHAGQQYVLFRITNNTRCETILWGSHERADRDVEHSCGMHDMHVSKIGFCPLLEGRSDNNGNS